MESFTFDFSGAGGIGLEDSNLEKRYNEAKKAIKAFGLSEPLNIVGSSMGGYIAIKLSEAFTVANLFLFCPAVYTKRAFSVAFGPEFSTIIRAKESWKYTDAFEILKKFYGNVFIIIGEQDAVIPKEIIQMMSESLIHAKRKKMITIPQATHKLYEYLEEHADYRDIVVKTLANL